MKPSFVIIIFLAFSLFQCNSLDQKEALLPPPNIVWLVAEDISPALGCYGNPLAHTPNIDGLAAKGIVYDKAYATAPICAPSRSCLATGLYATSMGTQHLRCEIPLSDKLKSLAEYMSEAGYFTSNRNKTDYNFDPQNRWIHWSSSIAPWRQREDQSQAFYSFINVDYSHEGYANITERYESAVKDLPENRKTPSSEVQVPPYYPETPETREVWAHYNDLLKVMDQHVGQVLDSLEADGLMDNTIIFFFGDHGFGMPRYKRWLYNTGLQVPLVVYVPEQYKELSTSVPGSRSNELVSFVDFPATTLNLAGAEIPSTMEGRAFLGKNKPAKRQYVYGARDRADDMFEMSRAITDGRYLYIRHFMPHLPYIQSGFINSDRKDAYRALRQAYKSDIINEEQKKLWLSKPIEELYDLQNDPQELDNLAKEEKLYTTKSKLEKALYDWMIRYRDLGLLTESEYMIQSAGSSPYDYARSEQFAVEQILKSAKLVGSNDIDAILKNIQDSDNGVRYWAAMGILNMKEQTKETKASLQKLLKDPSPSVQIIAAEALARYQAHPEALEVLKLLVLDDRPRVALEAARSLQLIGKQARPAIPAMYKAIEKNLSEPGSKRKFKDFNYASFTGWALEWALQELGEDIQVN